MKKITLLVLFVTLTSAFQAQTVIIDQPNNAAGNSLVCFEGNDGIGVYTSDDFVLTSDVILGEIDVFGRLSNVNNFTNLLSFNIYIYADNAGLPAGDPTQPGTAVVELPNISATDFTLTEDGAAAADFTVRVTDANGGTQITLPAGTYWLVAFPIVDEPFATGGTNRWNWNEATSANTGVEPVLIDPTDIFGAGATSWTNISGLIGATFPSNGFQIRDEPLLSTNDYTLDSVSISPNPATDFINIDLPNSSTAFSSEIYSITGQLVLKSDKAQLNVSNLNSGIYMLRIQTENGVVSRRVIKN